VTRWLIVVACVLLAAWVVGLLARWPARTNAWLFVAGCAVLAVSLVFARRESRR